MSLCYYYPPVIQELQRANLQQITERRMLEECSYLLVSTMHRVILNSLIRDTNPKT